MGVAEQRPRCNKPDSTVHWGAGDLPHVGRWPATYWGIPSQHALRADNARFDRFAGLHDCQQRDHAAQRKVDMIDRGALLVEHGVRPKLQRRQPWLDASELVSRKLAQDAVLYDVWDATSPPPSPLRWGRDHGMGERRAE
jgi:hypothetical protein